MFSDVLCCFQMFSDVPRMVSIVHRRFIDILKCVQDVFRCFHQIFKDVERCWEMVLDVLPIFSRCSLDVALMFSSCSPGLSIEFSVCSPEMWSNSILRWKYYLWWSKKIWRSLRDGLPKKVAVLLDFVQLRGGEGPAQIFWHIFISAFLVNKRSFFHPKCQ